MIFKIYQLQKKNKKIHQENQNNKKFKINKVYEKIGGKIEKFNTIFNQITAKKEEKTVIFSINFFIAVYWKQEAFCNSKKKC